ncbi:MAG: 5-keto-L-gluconate epimerase [bacterium]
MKLSIVLSTQPAAFSALAYKGQLAENVAKIAGLGYDGVEIAVRDPGLLNVPELVNIAGKNGLVIPAIGTGQAFGEEGISFIHPDPVVRRKAITRIKAQMDLAAELNALVIIGLIRGIRGRDISVKDAEARCIEALRDCADYKPDVQMVIEPINRYESDFLNTVDESLRFLDFVKRDSAGLLLDTFHMNIEEPSPLQSIHTAGERIFHFHIADSNRWHPGAGHLDFSEIVTTLEGTGYNGFLSAEILPLPDSDTAAAKTIAYMRSFI